MTRDRNGESEDVLAPAAVQQAPAFHAGNITRAVKLPLLAAMPFAVLVTVAGITESPLARNHDELEYLTGALRLLGEGRLTGYNHGSVWYEVLAAVHAACYGGLRLAGQVQSPDEYVLRFIEKTPAYLAVGRILTAAAAIMALTQVGRVARLIGGSPCAPMAVLLVGTNVTFVALSSTTKEEPLYWALILAATVEAWSARTTGRLSKWRWAGGLVAAATATKYFGVFWLLLAGLVVYDRRRVRAAAHFFGSAAVVFLTLCPFILTEQARFSQAILSLETGNAQYGGSRGFIAYAAYHIPNLVGWPVILLGLAELVRRARQRFRGPEILGAPAVVLAIWLASRRGTNFAYYIFPLALFLLILACACVLHITSRLRTCVRHLARLAIAAAVLLMPPFLPSSASLVLILRAPDTRLIAATFIERNVAAGDCVVIAEALRGENFYGPPLLARFTPSGSGVFSQARATALERIAGRPRYDLRLVGPPRLVHSDCGFLVAPEFNRPVIELQNAALISSDVPPADFVRIAEIQAQPYNRPYTFPYLTSIDYDALRMDPISVFRSAPTMGWTMAVYRRRSELGARK